MTAAGRTEDRAWYYSDATTGSTASQCIILCAALTRGWVVDATFDGVRDLHAADLHVVGSFTFVGRLSGMLMFPGGEYSHTSM